MAELVAFIGLEERHGKGIQSEQTDDLFVWLDRTGGRGPTEEHKQGLAAAYPGMQPNYKDRSALGLKKVMETPQDSQTPMSAQRPRAIRNRRVRSSDYLITTFNERAGTLIDPRSTRSPVHPRYVIGDRRGRRR